MAMLSYEFMRRAMLAASFMAIIAPLIGVFLVVRRQSLLADTLSHVSLAGIALGFFININPTLTTLFVVIVSAVVLEYLRMVYQTYSEVSTAILMSGGLATALVLMNANKGDSSMRIQQYLFGSIVTISQDQVIILGVLLILLVIIFSLFKRPMYVLTFDEDTAHVDGLPVRWMSLLFNVLTGIAITVMIPIAGALLVSAIMVLPAAISMRIGRSFNQVLLVSVVIGLIGMLGGLVTSYQVDTPPGATITLIFIGIFFLVMVIKKIKTYLYQSRKNKSI
ncbi:metal ABC transporter permease [Vagococcus sp. PNs007]|uniref:Metal ABC transporter permease n=1 Tax=Vagococcus proximus TaxID=2991417 RepID=A0ABT5X165_9ENTE|nr:metal ABC transporter permease [Vagococcus proximus]MDF0479747.1 metal ABC transporter permease [Vagococcus proximus]